MPEDSKDEETMVVEKEDLAKEFVKPRAHLVPESMIVYVLVLLTYLPQG